MYINITIHIIILITLTHDNTRISSGKYLFISATNCLNLKGFSWKGALVSCGDTVVSSGSKSNHSRNNSNLADITNFEA